MPQTAKTPDKLDYVENLVDRVDLFRQIERYL